MKPYTLIRDKKHKRITFTTLQQIERHRFVGNHADDHAAFTAIGRFVGDTANSLTHRAEALRIMMDEGMGCGRAETMSDTELVREYCEEQ